MPAEGDGALDEESTGVYLTIATIPATKFDDVTDAQLEQAVIDEVTALHNWTRPAPPADAPIEAARFAHSKFKIDDPDIVKLSSRQNLALGYHLRMFDAFAAEEARKVQATPRAERS